MRTECFRRCRALAMTVRNEPFVAQSQPAQRFDWTGLNMLSKATSPAGASGGSGASTSYNTTCYG